MNFQIILSLAPLLAIAAIGFMLRGQLAKHFAKQDQSGHELDKKLLLLQERFNQLGGQREEVQRLLKEQQKEQQDQRQAFDQHQAKSLKMIQEGMQQAFSEIRKQVTSSLTQHSDEISKRMEKLTHETQKRLKEISQEVDRQLTAGFEKTTATFTDVVKRLAIIDQAQKKITELSTSVVSLQEVLNDRRSRGAFGEVQLSGLLHNALPASSFSMQYTLSNGKRADCLLFLPEPTGNMAIDAKFPLETYRLMTERSTSLSDSERRQLEAQFKIDIRKHINDIADRYIIPGETADGAVMFIPAEAVFAEIHANFPELIEFAHRKRVWLVSPTTMMAVLTTARAVLKDEATRNQVHIIQEHLMALGKDFGRFQKRMDNLARHIDQAHQDVEQVHRSSQKISSRFTKIEKVELADALIGEPE